MKTAILFSLLLSSAAAADRNSGIRGLAKEVDTLMGDMNSEDALENADQEEFLMEEDYNTMMGMEDEDEDEDEFYFGTDAIEVFDPASFEDEEYLLDEDDSGDEEDDGERRLNSHHQRPRKFCYDFYPGAIRISKHHNAFGQKGKHYNLFHGKSESWCKSSCSSNHWCKAYEYNFHEKRCELWKFWFGFYQKNSSFKTYVKYQC